MADKNEQNVHDFKKKYEMFDLSYLSSTRRMKTTGLVVFFYAALISSIYFFMLNEKSDLNLLLAGGIGISIMSIIVLFFMNKGIFFYDAIKAIAFSYGIAITWAIFIILCFFLFDWMSPFWGSEYKIITVTDKFLIGISGTCKALFFGVIAFYVLKYPYIICRDTQKKHQGLVMAYKMQKEYETRGRGAKSVEEYISNNRHIWDNDICI